MAKNTPGLFDTFKGLWNRGDVNNTPPDHFSDSRNNCYDNGGVRSRDKTTSYLELNGIVRKALYKPNPPFTGLNVPRLIYLREDGNLYDENYPGTAIFGNGAMKDFALVNFFGRCYISPSDGRVGLSGQYINVYDGTGPGGLRTAAGLAPTTPLSANLHLPLGSGTLGVGTYLISYALETVSGFITGPATPFVAIDCFGASSIDITNLPIGSMVSGGTAAVAARWIIASKAIPLRADLTQPFDVATAEFYPLYLAVRVADNTTTTYSLSFYDEALVESADFLFTRLAAIPAGVGLLDYKGRMVSYGEYSNPSIVRVSDIGEPESYSATSGFFITDPSDSTGVRSGTEFRNLLYVYKGQRGYVTQDNGDSASTWDVVNFEKSIGTEQYGIASILDAKGSSTEGFIIASRGAIHYFNGTIAEPELSYKIRDLWKRINQANFYKMQLANDPINRRLYALVPLDASETCSHVIVGDYRDGLDPFRIKWDIWEFDSAPVSILIYNVFAASDPELVTRLTNSSKIVTLNVGIQGNDNGVAINSYFKFGPTRFSEGISHFNRVRVRGSGPTRLTITGYGKDDVNSVSVVDLSIPAAPGREYAQKMNLVSEECQLQIGCNILNLAYKIDWVKLEGAHLWGDRAQ